jgi:transposase-like protein
VLIVGTDGPAVETDLTGGRLACPTCGSGLRPWGHGIAREVRLLVGSERRRFRRSICSSCGTTHVLIPEDTLVRRRDAAEVIGTALTSKANGSGHRQIALALGRPVSTVRGWLRRFAAMAVALREHFCRWATALDPTHDRRSPGGSDLFDAVEAVGVLGVVAVRRFGPRPPWSLASVVTAGYLLANTSSPWVQPV